jgi:O-acetylserine/cysteine efflux transporter
MPFMLLQPLIVASAGVVFRDEVITMPMIIGGIGILIGVAIIIIRRPAVIAPSTKTGI